MLVVISPAKKLDFKSPSITDKFTLPKFLNETESIIQRLNKFNPTKISKLMGISANLGQVNYERFQKWHLPFRKTSNSPL